MVLDAHEVTHGVAKRNTPALLPGSVRSISVHFMKHLTLLFTPDEVRKSFAELDVFDGEAAYAGDVFVGPLHLAFLASSGSPHRLQ